MNIPLEVVKVYRPRCPLCGFNVMDFTSKERARKWLEKHLKYQHQQESPVVWTEEVEVNG